ncbi:hypothetical protein HRbin30_01948 [bacterium HR30]|nr:hypothetical protein HRbin30_01948 [bacterium HR30]
MGKELGESYPIVSGSWLFAEHDNAPSATAVPFPQGLAEAMPDHTMAHHHQGPRRTHSSSQLGAGRTRTAQALYEGCREYGSKAAWVRRLVST